MKEKIEDIKFNLIPKMEIILIDFLNAKNELFKLKELYKNNSDKKIFIY